MKSKLFWFGFVATALYAGGMVLAFWAKIPCLLNMPLNEVGDFLAGAFSPLAFLWLVLGFLQQGQELRQGTEALHLQAKELRSSVEAQQGLVSATRDQLKADLELAAEAKRNRAKLIQPFFVASATGGTHSGDEHELSFNFKNLGAPVSRIVFACQGDFSSITKSVDSMDNGELTRFSYEFKGSGEGLKDEIHIVYMDADLNVGEQRFSIRVDSSGSLPALAIQIAYL